MNRRAFLSALGLAAVAVPVATAAAATPAPDVTITLRGTLAGAESPEAFAEAFAAAVARHLRADR